MDTIIVRHLPAFYEFDLAKIGNFSVTTIDKKYIHHEHTIDHNEETNLPSKFFRDYFQNLKTTKQEIENSNVSYPYKSRSIRLPMAYYVDISRAFLQIASVYGAEVFVREGKYIALGESTFNDDLFNKSKLARGLLVTGTGKNGVFSLWHNRRIQTVKFYNQNYSPHLRYCIWRTLHAVMSKIDRYIVYCHTDGFIVPDFNYNTVTQILDDLQLNYKIKGEGHTIVRGVGSYYVGGMETMNKFKTPTKDNIIHDYSDWWLDKFAMCRKLR